VKKMKLQRRQRELRLTDRALAKRAGVSTATIHRAKKAGESHPNAKISGVSRYGPMEQIAAALECEVRDIDEFHPALRERVFREARKQGVPPEVLDQADQEFHLGLPPTPEALQFGAYTLLADIVDYLDRVGWGDLVDKAFRERR
jgi:DNA-binding Xre family transcriptional regulator